MSLTGTALRDQFLQGMSCAANTARGMVGHGLGFSLLGTKPASSMSYDGKALAVRPFSDKMAASRLVLARRRDGDIIQIAETFMWNCINVFGLEW